MKCPQCQKRMRQINKYHFKGYLKGVPGERLTYHCQHCGHREIILLIKEQDFNRLKNLYREKKLQVIEIELNLRKIIEGLEVNLIVKQGKSLQIQLDKFLKKLEKLW